MIIDADAAEVRSGDVPGGRWRPVLDVLQAETRSFVAGFSDDPDSLSDWGHRYFCPDDGGRLRWDRNSPTRHACVVCGTVWSGLPYDRAWTTFYRNEAFQTLRKAAALSRYRPFARDGGDDGVPGPGAKGAAPGAEWADAMRVILDFYASNYGKFALHAKDRVLDELNPDVAGSARIMPQGLNEAIILVRAAQATEIAAPALDARHPGFRDKVVRELFEPAVAILIPQLRKIHNIACWLDAAIGLVGLAAGREDLVSLALDEPGYGLQAQLRAGLTEDSLWFEGSVHYHYFALEAALSLLLAASRKGIRRPRAEYAVLNALDAGYRMAFSSGRFPAPNDGWPDVGLKTYAHVYDLAAAFFGPGSPADGLRAAIGDASGERVEVPLTPPWYYEDRIPLERLLFAPFPASAKDPAPPRQPYVLRGSCMAMLRRPGLEVYVKYGHNGPSHAHPDKMNLEVALGDGLLTRDLSNAGYGARLCDAWHRSSPAHNTVVVDGQDHVSTERGRMLWFGADRLSVRAVDVYPGVSFTRSITLTWSGFSDVFDVKAATPRVMDWFFHVDGELAEAPEGLMKDGDLGYGGAYSLLEGMRQLSPREVLELKFSVAGRIAILRADTRGIAAFVGRSLDNPVDGRRTVVVLRARSRRVRFDTEWTV